MLRYLALINGFETHALNLMYRGIRTFSEVYGSLYEVYQFQIHQLCAFCPLREID